jgi:hypothetical protein
MQIQAAPGWPATEDIFRDALTEVRPQVHVERVDLVYRPYVSATAKVQWRNGRLEVRLADFFQGAPRTAIESLAHILAHKMFRRPPAVFHLQRYRRFLNAPEIRRQLHRVRQQRGRKYVSGAQGRHYNLLPMFEDLNLRFFHGLMSRPDLGWSRGASRSILGHYDPSHNAIILSRLLDSPAAPLLAVEYVLYHEMLHLRHPAEHHGHRRHVHTPAFRKDEKLFPRLGEAREALKTLAAGPGLCRASGPPQNAAG